MSQPSLNRMLLLLGSILFSGYVTAQITGVPTTGVPAAEMPAVRFFTTTGVSLAFPVSSLRQVAENGRGTTFNVEYRIRPRFSIAGAWDAHFLPVQTTKLVAGLNPALKLAINELKGAYQTNAFGVYGIWYGKNRAIRPYLTGGVGLNVITVPELVYNPAIRLLSLESVSTLTGFLSGGIGINWQFSQPIAAFGEANAYIVPAGSPVAAGSNSFLTAKIGLRFPLF
jgi:hypothetical protein